MENSNIESGKYKPRFDFEKDQKTDPPETGSISELLEELNYEIAHASDGSKAKHSNASGKTITRKELKGVIDFINSTLGQEIPSGNCTLPISTLKTIKLLYIKNDSSDTQLLQRISKPGTIKATFEHWTERNSPRNEKTIKAASYLISTLEREIDEERRSHIHTNRLTPSKLLEYYAKHIKELIEPIYMAFDGNDEAIASAFMFGAHQIESYQPSTILPSKEAAPPPRKAVHLFANTPIPALRWRVSAGCRIRKRRVEQIQGRATLRSLHLLTDGVRCPIATCHITRSYSLLPANPCK